MPPPELRVVRELPEPIITRAGIEIGVASTKAFTAQLAGLFLLTGPTGYLPAPGTGGYDLEALPEARFHAGRPRPAVGAADRDVDHSLFWSLSFATTAETWSRITEEAASAASA